MRLLFIIQGEGRGHLTQALAIRSMLEKAGHEVSYVLAGSARHRELPEFFVEKIGAPVDRFGSPGFSMGADHRSIRPVSTLIENVVRAPQFISALKRIDERIAEIRPDLVLTFYEPMSGVYQALHRVDVPFVAVGHQYMFEHPAYRFAPGSMVDRSSITLFTRLTAIGASWKLALSLYPATDLPGARLTVVPPLLRPKVLEHENQDVPAEDFFLIYLLNRGYAEQVKTWHAENPGVRLECFWDHPDADDVDRYDETLSFHRLNDVTFVDLMARCSGLVCTAGFESVSEALFLGKPVMAVPVEGHFEQRCNAREVEMLGAGVRGEAFDLNVLTEFLPRYRPPAGAFRKWVSLAEEHVIDVLEAVAAGHRPPSRHRHAPIGEGLAHDAMPATSGARR